MTTTERLASDPAGISRAARLLSEGGLVAFPTETVYGLGADATNDRAVARIYEAKDRPVFNPLIVHVASDGTARDLAAFSDDAMALASAFWPGPLTLVLPLRHDAPISKLVTAGGESVALRLPAHPVACAILAQAGRPIAAPSANRSGRISPTTADHVLTTLDGLIDAVVYGGATDVGLESTIVGFDPDPVILRHGGVTAESIEAAIGRKPGLATACDRPSAPGQLRSHYAPSAPLRTNVLRPTADEVFLGFGEVDGDLNLSARGDLVEASANLFRHLHQLDRLKRPIAVAPIPDSGLGRAMNDRLARAAAPRG